MARQQRDQATQTRDGSFSAIEAAIEKYMRGHGMVRASHESLVPVVWAEVVGPWYAGHSEVTRVEKGVVNVTCDSAARAQQLQLDTPSVIEKLNQRCGARTVREIRASSGGIRKLDPVAARQDPPQPLGPGRSEMESMELTTDERLGVWEATAEIEDEGLRRCLQSVMVKARKAEDWKRRQGYRPCQICGTLTRPPRKKCGLCSLGRPRQGMAELVLQPYDERKWE
jgi:predicted nucleic acid-binding Zn ribbon protein